jgi:hypothetical protein
LLRTLKGVHLAFTGILSRKRQEAIRAARKAGAVVHRGPSVKTTVVVRGRPNPLQAAGREGGIKLMEIKRLREKGHRITDGRGRGGRTAGGEQGVAAAFQRAIYFFAAEVSDLTRRRSRRLRTRYFSPDSGCGAPREAPGPFARRPVAGGVDLLSAPPATRERPSAEPKKQRDTPSS